MKNENDELLKLNRQLDDLQAETRSLQRHELTLRNEHREILGQLLTEKERYIELLRSEIAATKMSMKEISNQIDNETMNISGLMAEVETSENAS